MQVSKGAEDKQKIILIVEDDKFLLEILEEEFSKNGFKVVAVRDGEQGLEAAANYKPELILADILMPKMDGITMLTKLRSNPATKNIPAIILTNLNDTENIDKALETGVYDFLVKSDWEPKDLVKRVREKLGMAS